MGQVPGAASRQRGEPLPAPTQSLSVQRPGDWYVRRGSAVQGPYALHQIQRYLLLGRVRTSDRVSEDGQRWTVLAELPALIPEEMRDLDSAEGRARFLAAHQRADERSRRERRALAAEEGGWEGGKERRRRSVPGGITGPYVAVALARRPSPVLVFSTAALMLGISLLLGAVLVSGWWVSDSGADCGAAPALGANWAYCVKDRASLSGTDLRYASLRNASVRNADLSGVDLQGADLSFGKFSNSDFGRANLGAATLVGADLAGARLNDADLGHAQLSAANLRGADVTDASFANARLDRAVWVDGRICLPQSIGRCNLDE